MHGDHRKRSCAVPTLLALAVAVLLFRGTPAGAAGGNAGSIWGANYFPNVPLVTQDNKQVRFFDDLIKDKVVTINFIYTSCPDVCPLETAMLREVQEILGDRVGRDVFMYSITIDPEHDTPEVMKKYAEKFEAAPGWLFLTGKKEDITLLRTKLGLYREEKGSEVLQAHQVSGIMGNQKTGRWMKMSPFENPYVMATQIGSWLHNYKSAPDVKEQNYANAPKVRNLSNGERLFRIRCAACHKIGGGAAGTPGKRGVGPDLLGVTTKRDRSWLTRWLAEPDKMLAEKDPRAVSLLAEYDNVMMPNFRLDSGEIEALLTYIAEESGRIEQGGNGVRTGPPR